MPPYALTDLAGLRVSAEDLLDVVSETASQPAWVVDPGDAIWFVNPAAIAALGYDSAEELLGRHRHETIHYEHPGGTPYPAATCPMQLPRTTGQTVARDLDWFFRRDGSTLPVSYVSLPIEMPEGRGAVVGFAEIEDRLRAERMLGGRDAVAGAREDSLRRIAALVAGGAASVDVFAAIAREVAHVVGLPLVLVWRFDPGKTSATVIAEWSEIPHSWQAGTHWPLDGPGLAVQMLKTGRPARIDDYAELSGTIAAASRKTRLLGSAGAPIIVDGDVWGWMAAASSRARLPDQIEDRLAEFTELVATAISNTESRAGLGRLAEEQAALRRVATLVASGTRPQEVFETVANEVGRLLSVDLANVIRFESDGTVTFVASAGDRLPVGSRWPLMGQSNLATLVFETGRPARLDDYGEATGALAEGIRAGGIRSAVGTPIIVEGRLWGLMTAGSTQELSLPSDTEARLGSFTELVAVAIANAAARAEVGRLVDEQAALRRVATLVAEGAAPLEVFETVTREVGILCGADLARMERYESGESVIGVAGWSRGGAPGPAVGTRFSLEGASIAALVREVIRPARVDSFVGAYGPIAREAQGLGIRSSVGCPIVVDGRLWGVIAASSKTARPFPPDTESQIAEFTELVATAIANTESHATANRLTEEQVALRRVATLVAKEASLAEVFAKVAEEVANGLGDVDCSLFRDEGDGTASAVALSGAGVSARLRVGARLPADGDGVIASVLRKGRPCRIGDYSAPTGAIAQLARELGIRSAVGCPIVVRGRLWGAMGAARHDADSFPPEAETRIERFADLVATAIANADARAEVERLAEEQAALRRVATLAARGAPPEEVFAAVAVEVERVFAVDAALARYESGATMTTVAISEGLADSFPVGSRWPLGGENVSTVVFETGRSARIDSYDDAPGRFGVAIRERRFVSSVGAPIVVEGRLWGVITLASAEHPLPADTEEHLASFSELVATAIANTEAQTELAASRARIVAATDEERRRVVRDLHDGAQQRLVHTIFTLKLAHGALQNGEEDLPDLLTAALDHAEQATGELRELAHGILPGALTHGGLPAAVGTLASRMPVPVEIDVSVGRLPAAIEATAYFVVAEALTNVAKHARAAHATVTARVEDGAVEVRVRDDGVGGARPDGSGLLGLADRLSVLEGQLRVESPVDGGTLIAADIPLSSYTETDSRRSGVRGNG